MKRVLVIGCPGTGKTTFAKRLAAAADLPLHHLDFYYHSEHPNYQEDKKLWRKKVEELVASPKWIIDGNYKSTFGIRFKHADTIVFLDYPLLISLTRAIVRRIRFHKKVRDDMPRNWREKLSPELIKFIMTYNRIERPEVIRLLEELSEEKRVVRFASPRKAEQYLAGLSHA